MTRSAPDQRLRSIRPSASALARGGGTLEDHYRRWEAARQQWTEAERGFQEERRRLDEEGDFLLGTIQAAQAGGAASSASNEDLAVPEAMQRFVAEAEARLAASREALSERERAARAEAEQLLEEGRAEVQAAIERYRELVPLRLTLMRRPLAGGRAILHLERPGPDSAMVLAWVLTGKLPTRYGYLFDEASDDPMETPPSLYAEAGVATDGVRPDPAQLRTLLEGAAEALPLRGMIPTWVPVPGAQVPALARWRARGVVLELEWEEGDGFRSLLSTAEAAAAAGVLLRLQLEGALMLELQAG